MVTIFTKNVVKVLLREVEQKLKGAIYENVCKREQYHPRTITFMLKIYSSLKTKADFAGGDLTAGSASNLNISAEIRTYIQNNFRVSIRGSGVLKNGTLFRNSL